MRRRLASLVAATTTLVLLAFLVPLSKLIDTAASDNAKSTATNYSQLLVPIVTSGDDPEIEAAAREVAKKGYAVTVVMPDGRKLGAQSGPSAVESAVTDSRSTTVSTVPGKGDVVVHQPVFRGDGDPAIISTLVPDTILDKGVKRAWVVLAVLGVLLVGISLVVADRLARSMTRPVTALARTAERLGRGELDARVEPGGPPEIREVGLALNRLAARIGDLLASERETVADLSHRLRTPVTALRLDAEGLTDGEERDRLVADVDDLTRQVDAVIREARRPVREGVEARCDATQVVRDRVGFWRVLADDQNRTLRLSLPAVPAPVRANESDLAAAVDALLGNVFSHTPDGTGFGIDVRLTPGRGVEIVVADDGPGFADGNVMTRGESRTGSTGLGLDIVRRTAQAAGGDVEIQTTPGRGAVIVVRLGPPA